jgi:hypothetical protein
MRKSVGFEPLRLVKQVKSYSAGVGADVRGGHQAQRMEGRERTIPEIEPPLEPQKRSHQEYTANPARFYESEHEADDDGSIVEVAVLRYR